MSWRRLVASLGLIQPRKQFQTVATSMETNAKLRSRLGASRLASVCRVSGWHTVRSSAHTCWDVWKGPRKALLHAFSDWTAGLASVEQRRWRDGNFDESSRACWCHGACGAALRESARIDGRGQAACGTCLILSACFIEVFFVVMACLGNVRAGGHVGGGLSVAVFCVSDSTSLFV